MAENRMELEEETPIVETKPFGDNPTSSGTTEHSATRFYIHQKF